jgi:hypothetical protein
MLEIKAQQARERARGHSHLDIQQMLVHLVGA